MRRKAAGDGFQSRSEIIKMDGGSRMTQPGGPLQGKVALITGAGRGIGAAIAFKLSELGAKLMLTGRSSSPLEKTASQIGTTNGTAEIALCDVGDRSSVKALAERVESRMGRLDILVNNAGVGDFSGPLHQLAPETWDKILRTNLTGVFNMIQAFAPVMIRARDGHIINISSIASKNALPSGAAYAASKWGLNGLTFSVAEELRTFNIRVSAICPGSVHPEFTPHSGKDPLKMLQPEDIAHAVEMLVMQSPQSFASEIVLRPTMKP
jgi:NAD(P)-dependent dehydrogenase (short-subunit alcohol dehydrogenase family)